MSSFFYPQQHHPFFDLFDQPHSHFYSPPDSSYQRPPSHHPHRHSAGIFHPQDRGGYHHHRQSHHPLAHLHQQNLDDRDYYSPEHLRYGHHDSSPHPLHQLRQRKLDRDALGNQSHRYSHPSSHRPLLFRENSPDYEDSIRAERARRLAEAKRRHLGHSSAEDEEMKVQVTLPDGRQCVVPISWAKKMQSKYPGILTNSMIRPHLERSESPVRLDRPLATSDSDQDDSDFYVLDPSQDPSVPVLASESPPARLGPRSSPSPKPPQHSPEELDAAARLIQQQFRTHRSMKQLAELESTFDRLKTGFIYPSLLDLKFLDSPEQASSATPSSTKLAFNHPVNRTVQAFEEGLAQLQIKADAILSRGNPKVKDWRKRLIKAIEAQLEQLDRFKTEAWTAQRAAHLENLAKTNHQAEECEDVEMNDEIMNTDVESVSSDRLNVNSGALATPLWSTGEEPQRDKREEEDVIIPVAERASGSLETLVIPASSCSTAPNAAPSAPPDSSASHPAIQASCLVNPSVSSDGNLICPATKPSLSDDDDILVSPV